MHDYEVIVDKSEYGPLPLPVKFKLEAQKKAAREAKRRKYGHGVPHFSVLLSCPDCGAVHTMNVSAGTRPSHDKRCTKCGGVHHLIKWNEPFA